MSDTHSKSDRFYTRIRGDILSLYLHPSAPLRLSALSEHYQIGMTPLREALNRLATEKLIIPEHNKGFRVAGLCRGDLLDLERSRNAIEGVLFTQAITSGQDEWEAGIIGTYHQLNRVPVPSLLDAVGDTALWEKRHNAFHDALIASARSGWMHQFRKQLADHLVRYQRFIQNELRLLADTHPDIATRAADVLSSAMALAPHTTLYDAALARDVDQARQRFEAHATLSIHAFEQLTAMMPSNTIEKVSA